MLNFYTLSNHFSEKEERPRNAALVPNTIAKDNNSKKETGLASILEEFENGMRPTSQFGHGSNYHPSRVFVAPKKELTPTQSGSLPLVADPLILNSSSLKS